MKFLLSVFLMIPLTAQASPQGANLQQALDQAVSSYPLRRYLAGSADAILGGVTGIGGFILSLDSTKPGDETLVGLAGTVVGSVMGLDGLIRLFHPAALEWEYPFFSKMPEGGDKIWKSRADYGEALLQRSAERAKTARTLRIVGGFLSSAFHLYLFQKGQPRYKGLIVPGTALGLMAIYRLLVSAPEESAWDSYGQKSVGNLRVTPSGLAWQF